MRSASGRASGRAAAACSPRPSSRPTSVASPGCRIGWTRSPVALRSAGWTWMRSTWRRAARSTMRSERDAFLGVAGELAHGIAASAVWDGSRCNWVGALPPGDPRGTRAIASLGADLYGGTSGVALFLAEAGARLDDDAVREAAQGAIAHAL